ncbi:MAG: 16S rRNA (uracil(1498)-N(3))-methyltransferase [Candidatus Nanopelagicaceae bacterium]|nr:16S rRNA (uracil(1498)-N(3))-methyltransferase [Candidatus Nanopelagicaceae bacterium]
MLPLFLVENLPNSGSLEIDGDEAKHAISALRIKEGELISVTDGRGARADALVIGVTRKTIAIEIKSYRFEENSLVKLTVVQALTKGDRARETIELLTEAGVNQIIPWSAQRCVGQWKDDALEKWRSWSKEATKQSRRSWIPEISNIHSTNDVVSELSNFNISLIFHESGERKLSQVLQDKSPSSLLMIIGPEGGISETELSAFKASGAIEVAMGQPVFRSAHAGAAALAAVQTGLRIW